MRKRIINIKSCKNAHNAGERRKGDALTLNAQMETRITNARSISTFPGRLMRLKMGKAAFIGRREKESCESWASRGVRRGKKRISEKCLVTANIRILSNMLCNSKY